MKILSVFTLIILGFVGCTSAKYQEMQNERDRLRAAHEDAERKYDPRQLETALTDKLMGTWQFLDMEVAEGDLSEEIAALKYKRHAAARQNLTLEFFMDRNVFRRYRSKMGTQRRREVSKSVHGVTVMNRFHTFGFSGTQVCRSTIF